MASPGKNKNGGSRSTIVASIRSPLSLFALAVLICDAVFAAAAASLKSLPAFVYSMHMFLGIIGAFTIIALWSPKTLYHPDDIKDPKKFEIGRFQIVINLVITMLILILLAKYWEREREKAERQEQAVAQIVTSIKEGLVADKSDFTLKCTKQAGSEAGKGSEITCQLVYMQKEETKKPVKE